MIFSDSAIFIEKKRVENWLCAKSEFWWAILFYSCSYLQQPSVVSDVP